MGVLLLKPNDLQGLVSMKDAIDAVEQGYQDQLNTPSLTGHGVNFIRRLACVVNFPGGVHQLGVMGAQVRAELVVQEGDNQRYDHRELPVHVLHDSTSGRLLAVLFGEMTKRLSVLSLMAFRTAATSELGSVIWYVAINRPLVCLVPVDGSQSAFGTDHRKAGDTAR